MGLSNGKITAPINYAEPYQCMGVGKYNGSYDLGYICSNAHGKLNIYSYIKPIDVNQKEDVQFTNAKYLASLVPVRYIGGNAAPANFKWGYNAPKSFLRINDFNGYDHYEYPVRVDMSSIPDTMEFEDSYSFKVSYDIGSEHSTAYWLFNYYTSHAQYWNASTVSVINIGGTNMAVLGTRRAFNEYRISVGFNAIKELYFALRNNGAASFKVTSFAVIIPYEQSVPDGFNITGYKTPLLCFPASPVCIPNRSYNLLKPKRRCFMRLYIEDKGDGIDSYVPRGTVIQAMMTYNSENVFVLSSYEFSEREQYEEDTSRLNEGTNYVKGEVQIPDIKWTSTSGYTKPEIFHNADRISYEAGLHTTFLYWDRKVAGDEFEMNVGFSYNVPVRE